MAKKNILFTDFWGEEISKRQYVDEKIRIFSEMELFSTNSIVNDREQAKKLSDFKHCICKILMSCETEVQIDNLARMLIAGGLSPEVFVKKYYDRING